MTPEKREQTRDLLVQDLKHYRHPKERDLLRTLESRFTSGNDVPVTRAMITREEYEQLRSLLIDREGFTRPEAQGETPKEVTKSGIPLTWGRNRRDGKEHTEWHAPCGCAWHPNPAPHWHPCSIHTPQAGEE